jgi:hypothetical protein
MVWTPMMRGKKAKIEGAPAKAENLLLLEELIEAGKLETAVDRRHPLDQVAEASGYVERGRKREMS